MEDDIDIEEHDVLDNPRIKHMYPYITSIKTEIEDYDEEETALEAKKEFTAYTVPATVIPDKVVKSFNNKIIIGSKPCTSSSQTSRLVYPGTSFQGTVGRGTSYEEELFEGTSDQDLVFPATFLKERHFQNKIILGSKKPDSSEESDSVDEGFDLPKVYVLVEDCKNFLEKNPCFCKECEILFPTHNDLDAHKMTAHSFLVAVRTNKAVKSTSKASNIDSKSLLCNHCNIVFPNTTALLRHTYELIPGKFACKECDMVFENDVACKTHMLKHNREKKFTSPTETYVVCKICSCHFKRIGKLETHMLMFHGTPEIGDVKRVLSNFQCHICNTTLCNSRQYNSHIMTCHSMRYHANYADFEKISRYQCPRCSLCFSSDYSVRIHLAAKHGYLGNVEDSKKIAQSRKISKESKNIDTFLKVPAKSQKNQSRNITKTRPLPKSTLFKCNKCNIHFLSCISAVLHSRTCASTSKKGNYKCLQCRRTFIVQDKFYHDYQHNISDRLKVIEINRNILNRILCKCKTCDVCFDEKNFMTFHTDSCNAETPSIQCKQCSVMIHLRDLPAHKKIHASGLSARDFIVIDYVHATTSLKEQEKTGLIDKFKTKTVKFTKAKPTKPASQASKYRRAKRIDYKSYYYCPTCKCYMRINTDKHSIGQCNTEISTTTCKSCGLRFTQKGSVNHKKVHRMFPKLKLKDLKFINIQTSRRICPPFPNFKKCKRCKVIFFSEVALRNHACNSEESKKCAYCKDKFSDLAYKLHIAYHEYAATVSLNEDGKETNSEMSSINENIPDLMKKYESLKQVWNILYLCQACDIVTDTYDKVVEHCQDHFCNMQSYNVTIEHCNICDLNFVNACFKRHEKLHLNDMDKDSFIILEYNYENLLSETWMDMFQSLTKEQIQLILSKSMYKFTRCVRMKVVSNGSLDLNLYQCGKCESIVAPNRVLEHSQNVNGSCNKSSKRFRCSVCSFRFTYKSHKIVHEKLHEIRKVDAKSFRIIQFHADKQFSVAEVKPNEINVINDEQKKNPEGLKFIRCQHCGKLINKQKYKSHMSYHYYYNRSKSKIKPSKPQQHPQKVHNFYICRDCKVCVAKESIKLHICDVNSKKKKCVKCSLSFRVQNLAAHYKSHERHKFTRSNMRIMYFDGEVIDKKSARRPPVENKSFNKAMTLYQCSQCNICIWHKKNIYKHFCLPDSRWFQCKICDIVLHKSRQSSHKKLHETRIFNSTNIQLIKFNGRKPPKSKNPVSHKRKLPTSYQETVNKKPKIENKLFKKCATLEVKRYYKCKTCKLLFVEFNELIDHENSCATDRIAAKCKDCGLVFHAAAIAKHRNLQECKIHLKHNLYIFTIQRKGKSYERDSMWIFLCLNCDTFNISLKGILYHLRENHQSRYTVQTCEQCDIKFTSTSFKSHLKLHHGEEEARVSDLSIAAVEDTTLVKALQDLPDDEDVVYVDAETKKEHGETSTEIYGCDECGLNFVNQNTLIKHKNKGEHRETHHSCKLCGLNFTLRSLRKHMNIHHTYDKMNDGKTSQADENESVDESAGIFEDKQSNTTIDHDEQETMSELVKDLPDNNSNDVDPLIPSFSDKSGGENVSIDNYTDKNDKPTKIPPGIYNCNVCDMNFLHPDSLHKHKRLNKHKEVRHKCKICGLIFSVISIKRHVAFHHKKTSILNVNKRSKSDVNDSALESTSEIVDNNKSNTSLIQDKTKNTTNTSINKGNNSTICNPNNTLSENITKNVNINPSTNEEDNSRVTFNNTVRNSRNVQDNLNSVGNASGKTPNENNTVGTEVLNKNKLFKCNICNVYFLTSEDCCEHTTNHIQLDTFEYIACKICNLQFCCEFLGRHMKSHREKTFSTDDLIVAEYHLSGSGQVKIDTYLFVDRLKAKLVSTTTHFDAEAVDSTTENVSLNDPSESTPCFETL